WKLFKIEKTGMVQIEAQKHRVVNAFQNNICKYNKKRMINRNILHHSFFIGLLFIVLLFSL
ncbi:hypothetical protein, partial [Bacillus cereus]|uniref:hypothetical protein n=1 Tax=Bacillus cereus TaxID=1396 RepID=UPI0021124AA5|nr:hypothetical protein [Bacillus cereus]